MNENLILSAICLLLVPIIFQIRVYKYAKALSQSQLPSTKGKIVSTKVDVELHDYEDQNGLTSRDYTYKPKITYSYELSGRLFENTRFSTMDEPSFHNQTDADRFINKYEVGEQISVYYDPNQPTTSFLSTEIKEKRINSTTLVLMFTFLLLSLIFLFMAIL